MSNLSFINKSLRVGRKQMWEARYYVAEAHDDAIGAFPRRKGEGKARKVNLDE